MSSQAAAVVAWRSALASADAEAFGRVQADLAATRSLGVRDTEDTPEGDEEPNDPPQPGPAAGQGEEGAGSGDGA